MLFTVAIVLLCAWVASLSGAFPGGDLSHVLLLVGLLLLLLTFAKRRDAALHSDRPASRSSDKR